MACMILERSSMKNFKTEGGTLISQIHQVCQRVWHRILQEHGLEDMAGARGRVLFALWTEDHIPIRKLVEKTSLDKSTLTGILDRLERDGYVRRTHSLEDRRTVIISRTGKDELYKEQMPLVSDQMNEVFYKGFSDEEIIDFEEKCRRILRNCKDAEGGK